MVVLLPHEKTRATGFRTREKYSVSDQRVPQSTQLRTPTIFLQKMIAHKISGSAPVKHLSSEHKRVSVNAMGHAPPICIHTRTRYLIVYMENYVQKEGKYIPTPLSSNRTFRHLLFEGKEGGDKCTDIEATLGPLKSSGSVALNG